MKQTYRSTSLRCTDFVPPHMGMVKVGGEESAMGPFRRFRDERERARVGATKDGRGSRSRSRDRDGTEVRVRECPNDGWR